MERLLILYLIRGGASAPAPGRQSYFVGTRNGLDA